jgi:hypothetical protein
MPSSDGARIRLPFRQACRTVFVMPEEDLGADTPDTVDKDRGHEERHLPASAHGPMKLLIRPRTLRSSAGPAEFLRARLIWPPL